MASETSICNQSLSWLAASPISSIDDNTVNGRLCKANYGEMRDATLESVAWTFATKRYEFTPVTQNGNEDIYANKFLIPSVVLRVLECREDKLRPNGTAYLDWRREGQHIVSDSAIIYAKCIVQITDTNQMSPLFRQCVAARLAAVLSPTITESNTKTNELWNLYGNYEQIAKAADGTQGKNDRIRSFALTRRVR